MRAYTDSFPVDSLEIDALFVLVVEPEIAKRRDPGVLLFLHGMGEAGSSLGELPLVAIHQTPPFLALLGCFPETVIVAPQAPPIPSREHWNWRDHVTGLAEFLMNRYAGRRIVATGFSRGGLGVLQLVSTYPALIQRWAVVDPQPARDEEETSLILRSPGFRAGGWLRYGTYQHREGWQNFSSRLLNGLPPGDRDTAERSHVEMAVEAYRGSSLSADAHKKNMYQHLDLKFAPIGQCER